MIVTRGTHLWWICIPLHSIHSLLANNLTLHHCTNFAFDFHLLSIAATFVLLANISPLSPFSLLFLSSLSLSCLLSPVSSFPSISLLDNTYNPGPKCQVIVWAATAHLIVVRTGTALLLSYVEHTFEGKVPLKRICLCFDKKTI